MATVVGTGFSARSRVYWHGTFPDFTKQGRVVEPGKVTDLRQKVLWDGREQPTWEWTTCLLKVSEHKQCPCGRCGKKV